MAGVSAVVAGVLLLVSGCCLALFFRTQDERWGRANDATTASFALAMVAPVFELRDLLPGSDTWATALTVLTVIGLFAIAVTSGLTAAKRLDWRISAAAGGVGFVPYLLWLGAASISSVGAGGLPPALGVLGLATLTLALLAVLPTVRFVRAGGVGAARLPPAAIVLLTAAFLCVPTWTVALGLSL